MKEHPHYYLQTPEFLLLRTLACYQCVGQHYTARSYFLHPLRGHENGWWLPWIVSARGEAFPVGVAAYADDLNRRHNGSKGIRKVKCDETKPTCKRCTATGRQCDGYSPVTTSSANKSELRRYRPHHVFPGAHGVGEGRALQYFCQVAGPYMSGAVNPHFWSKLVMQFTSFEPAARHSVIAISTLCERVHFQEEMAEELRLKDELYALQHYNAAIHDLRTMTSAERSPVVLLACLLFITVEFLQSNRDGAIKHCKHGFELLKITIRDYAWTKEHLLPLFRRLSIFAFLHAVDPKDFPDLEGLEHPVPSSFSTSSDARIMIDDIFSRTMRLVRNGDPYRIHPEEYQLVPPNLLVEQAKLASSLDQWKILFDELEARPSSPPSDSVPGLETLTKTLQYILLSRYECCRIWLNTAFGDGGYDYENHLAAFKAISTDAGIVDPEVLATFEGSPYFTFDTGYLPSISLAATRCSHLETTLKNLRLKPLPGLPRENMCLPAQAGVCMCEARPTPSPNQTSADLERFEIVD
ncbi:C6 zinc finger protein [Colletotrichum orchidophilum]|uniref:C6 zinc finger protein n=1 Tax=Colletotrichum orchidophilum TaxID=1209926 RepID=A0A1G4AW78_9PEZI|nr:C6 zinc finger protein [Colletotrichum orchidophilum]OHE93419.1 C6 zinc finger protein [Colletotrichum orchidophilum]